MLSLSKRMIRLANWHTVFIEHYDKKSFCSTQALGHPFFFTYLVWGLFRSGISYKLPAKLILTVGALKTRAWTQNLFYLYPSALAIELFRYLFSATLAQCVITKSLVRHGWELNQAHRGDRQPDTFILPLSYRVWPSNGILFGRFVAMEEQMTEYASSLPPESNVK